MSVDRRDLMQAGAVLGLAAAIPDVLLCSPRAKGAEAPSATLLSSLTETMFAEQVKTTFWLQASSSSPMVPLELMEVTHLESRNAAAKVVAEGFSLVFSQAGSERLPQGVYRVSHDRLGTFDLLFVPIVARPASPRYEAVFYRLRAG